MSNTTDQMTAEQLASLPDDGSRRELVEGILHMMSPAGGRHGRVAAKLLLRVGVHAEQQDLGRTFAALYPAFGWTLPNYSTRSH